MSRFSQWMYLLESQPRTDREWARFWRAYAMVYGVDTAPFWAHRPEWDYYQGYEIAQYEREQDMREQHA